MKTAKPFDFTKIKTYEAACKIKGIDPIANLPYPNPVTDEDHADNANRKLRTIINVVINGAPDNTRIYYPRFWKEPKKAGSGSGLGLSFDDLGYGSSDTTVSVRLCVCSREQVNHMVKYFLPIYEIATMPA